MAVAERVENRPSVFVPQPPIEFVNVTEGTHRQYRVPLLDRRVLYTSCDGNTVRVRQVFLGWHDNVPEFQTAYRHAEGWQGQETVVDFYRIRTKLGDGSEEVFTRQIDISPGISFG